MQKKLTKILVLSEMLMNEIDNPLATSTRKDIKEVQSKLNDVNKLLIPIVDEFYSNKTISRTNLFSTLAQKFEYNINKEIK